MTPELVALVKLTAAKLHSGDKTGAARCVLSLIGGKEPRNDEEANEPLLTFFYFLLNADQYELAAQLAWPATMFTAEPRCTRLCWDAIRRSTTVLLQGSSSMSKTYGGGVYFFLDWVRDPEYTTVKVLGPSEDHLQNNLFSHLVTLHRSAAFPMPGIVGDLFIGLDLRNRRGAITGVVVPVGRKASGRLQGVKRFPRKEPHPKFGKLSRLRILLDEFEKIPHGIMADLDNVVSNVEGTEGLKVVGAYNPQDVGGPVYVRAEPQTGWGQFDIEKDEVWVSKRGWTVVRLDAERCENVVSGQVLFPGLQTKEGLDLLAQMSGGRQSAGYYTFGRGAYPPQGTEFSIIPSATINKMRGRFIWLDNPRAVGGLDCALEGDDPAMFCCGEWGLATGYELAPCVEHPAGRTVMFRDAQGKAAPRWGLQISKMFPVPRGDTVAVARDAKRVAQALGIDPGWLMLDRTGNGAGVHDLLGDIWAREVKGVNYSEGPTHTKIFGEDAQFCEDVYDRVHSELWFALRRWAEFDLVKVDPSVDTTKLFEQFTTRLYRTDFRKQRVESKRDYKSRGFKSPNEADSVTLVLHAVRMASGITPSMNASIAPYRDDEDDPPRVSTSERLDDLEARHSNRPFDDDDLT